LQILRTQEVTENNEYRSASLKGSASSTRYKK